jgi:2,5-diketo-D-gluconate reductase A
MPDHPVVVPAPPVPPAFLNDGWHIPTLGFGVWKIDNDRVDEAVSTALEAGNRHLDTAQGYDNETGVGAALISSSLKRNEVFVTSKLRTKSMGYEPALDGIKEIPRRPEAGLP